ncbi:hypothetical protein H4684_001946 [Desulfomicrobium macestii]|uniref:Uncharacterized protein n=1 Tax=Desulfomicrobium macestii TaxID=90731 RepID=A0ABR9H3K5_9BACT|nr:hypothetical protein [Desulfomicrobium macestii]MBE1425295.1 hypothetical protein [Desulfomicrobium macestii]
MTKEELAVDATFLVAEMQKEIARSKKVKDNADCAISVKKVRQ